MAQTWASSKAKQGAHLKQPPLLASSSQAAPAYACAPQIDGFRVKVLGTMLIWERRHAKRDGASLGIGQVSVVDVHGVSVGNLAGNGIGDSNRGLLICARLVGAILLGLKHVMRTWCQKDNRQ